MAATGTPTPNIGLRRAQGTDPASVDDINYNSALIDTKLGAVGNSSVQDQIDTLNSNIANIHGVNRTTYTLTEEFTIQANNSVSVVTFPNAGLPNGAYVISMSMFTYNQLGTQNLIPVKTKWYSNSYITIVNPTNNAITAPVGLEIEIFYYI